MVLRFSDFINEARKDKETLVDTLIKLLNNKPSVKTSKVTYKDVYSMSAIIQYFKDNNMSNQNATDALHTIQNSKEYKSKLKSISIRDYKNKANYPYFYMDLSSSEVDKIKKNLEEKSKKDAEPELLKRAEVRKKVTAAKKTEVKKKTIKK